MELNAETPPLTCGIMLPTHNRLEDLQRTLAVIAQLDPPPDEVLITADACSDNTAEWVRASFPSWRLIVNQTARGSIVSRATMARASTSDLLLSIDDDSYPLEGDAIARLRRLFAEHPRLAVASFPQRSDEAPESLSVASFGPPRFDGTYVNCACAFRRQVMLELGGPFEPFWHAYDEPDFTLRCVSAGWQVRFDPVLTIRHHFSGANRNEVRVHHLHARNELWSVLLRCPAPQLVAVALFRAARQFGYACRRGVAWVIREPRWWMECLAGAGSCLAERRPVKWRAYLEWMRLVRHPIASEEEWEARFGRGGSR